VQKRPILILLATAAIAFVFSRLAHADATTTPAVPATIAHAIAALKTGDADAFAASYAVADPKQWATLKQQFALIKAERDLQKSAEYHFGTDEIAQLPGPDNVRLDACAAAYANATIDETATTMTVRPARDSGMPTLTLIKAIDGCKIRDPEIIAPLDVAPEKIAATIAAIHTVLTEIDAQKLWTTRDALLRVKSLVAASATTQSATQPAPAK
jgi:hypothetical protein